MKKQKVNWEYSAGGVVFKKEGKKTLWLIIQPEGTERWQLPKGKIEEGEKSEPTALREVKEEGGVEARVMADLGKVVYFYNWEKEKIGKHVRFFLMEYVGGNPKDHDSEVEKAEFFEFNEAFKKLTFKNSKEVLEKAKKILGEKEKQQSLL
jgi:8-oxo-dGTP pyrophosphatase MutT (NUDIX family)